MRAVLFLASVAALVALAHGQADLFDLQFPDYIATFDAGLPNMATGALSAATSVSKVAGQVAPLTGAQGACFVNVYGNLVVVNMTYMGLSSGIAYSVDGGAHLHGPASTATAADPFFTSENPQVVTSAFTNLTSACWTNGNNVPSGNCGWLAGQAMLSNSQITQLENLAQYNMNYYCNIHSLNNQNGELRGQIYPTTNRYMAACDNAQAGVTGSTTGSCSAWCNLDESAGVTCGGQWWGLGSAVAAAHLHLPGPQGGASNPWLFLNTFVNGTQGSWGTFQGGPLTDPLANTTNNFDAILAIRSDFSYINVHTSTYGNGEVRGQLHMVNSDPAAFAPSSTAASTPKFYNSGATTAQGCQATSGMGAGMYVSGCASVSSQWVLSENIALYSDSACSSIVSAVNRQSRLYNQGVHKLWIGMDVTRHDPITVTAVTNNAADISAWNSVCACGGTWVANMPRTISSCSGCPWFNSNYHAGVFNSTGYWFTPGVSWTSAQQVLTNSNGTWPASSLNSYPSAAAASLTQCTDFTTTTYFHSGAAAVAPTMVVALAAVVAFFAAKDV
jgi:hypothetical protein